MSLPRLVRRYVVSVGLPAAIVLTRVGAAPEPSRGQPYSQTPPAPQTRPLRTVDSDQIGRERLQYLALAEGVCQGEVESALEQLSTWDWRSFADIRGHMRQFGGWQLREVQCAALMHTEMALRAVPRSTEEVSHLNWARQLLRLLDGQLIDQSFRHDWFVAVAAHLHGQFRFVELHDYLSEATRAFPDEAEIPFAWGLLREAQTSPHLAVVAAGLPGRTETFLGPFPDRRGALREAEQYFRRALARDDTMLEARVRLGHVLDLRGRPDDALDTLAVARAQIGDRRLAYLASLFTGDILERRGRLNDAIEAYRSAEAAYPGCQAGAIALSHATREAGDRGEAERLVRQILRGAAGEQCEDPWLLYDFGLAPQADALFDRLRAKVRP
jgi:tetratricopeptide (TPR) repeat protein